MHWTRKYISRPYSELNCAELVELVIKEQLGIKFTFPQSNGNIFYESARIREHFLDYVEPEKTTKPENCSLVVMHANRRMCHVGLFVKYGGASYVLHSLKSAGSVCLHRIEDLNYYGLVLEGFYKWQK